MTTNNTQREAGIVFTLGLILFTVLLNARDFIGLECRFGIFAKEMFHNGITFFPTLYGKPYPDYPICHTLLIYLASHLWGGQVTIVTAVLPTAISAACTLCLTYLIGAMRSRSLAIWAVLLELGTFLFFAHGRSVSMDHFIATLTAASFYLVYTADLYSRPRRRWLVAAALVAGFALRGPIGLVMPAAVVFSYYAITKQWKSLLATCLLSALLLAASTAILLYGAYLAGGQEWLNLVWWMQVSGRVREMHAKPWYYYLTNGMAKYAISFPLALCVLVGFGKRLWQSTATAATSLEGQKLRFLQTITGWLGILLLGMSLPAAKADRYILAITPATALIAAHLFSDTCLTLWLTRLRSCFVGLCQVLPFLGIVAMGVALAIFHYSSAGQTVATQWNVVLAPVLPSLLLLTLGGMVVWMQCQRLTWDRDRREMALGGVGIAAFIVIHILVIEPVSVQVMGSRPLASRIETLRQDQETVIFYHGPDNHELKYMVHVNRKLMPQFVRNPEQLMAMATPGYLFVQKDDWESLSPQIHDKARLVAEGRLAHKAYVVCRWYGTK